LPRSVLRSLKLSRNAGARSKIGSCSRNADARSSQQDRELLAMPTLAARSKIGSCSRNADTRSSRTKDTNEGTGRDVWRR
jgi:hypothetical protein